MSGDTVEHHPSGRLATNPRWQFKSRPRLPFEKSWNVFPPREDGARRVTTAGELGFQRVV